MLTFIHTIRIIKIKIHVKNLMISSVVAQNFEKDLKPLSGVLKSQIGELMVTAVTWSW